MESLNNAYRNGQLILFVGSGVSSNLGLPSWSDLMKQISTNLGFDTDVFMSYGSNLALAEYYRLSTGSIGPLRSWMDREWHDSRIDVSASKIHKYITMGKFPLIYTTNYDKWIEKAHEYYEIPFSKIASVSDLVTTIDRRREIIKFHGDFDDDSSIVLDESSYFERLAFESPLDIKLRADVLGKSILFIGYSLNDINIRYILFKLSNLWSKDFKSKIRPKSYIFTTRMNPVQELILSNWGVESIVSETDDPGLALSNFLENLIGDKH